MERLKGSLLITPKEIQLITGKGYGAAHREHLTIRDALGKTSNHLTVKEYAEYCHLDYQEVVQLLNEYR